MGLIVGSPRSGNENMRVFKIRATSGTQPNGEPNYRYYLFIDTQNTSKREIKVLFWHTHCDLFDRPELQVEYLKKNDTVELTASQIISIYGRTVWFEIEN